MKFSLLATILLVSLAVSCQDTTAPAPKAGGTQAITFFNSGRLLVRVYFDQDGVPDKRVEIVELGLVRTTDSSGYASFVLPEGAYTLRAYDINRGGPSLLKYDTPVKIRAHDETRVDIFDCLPCV